MIKVTMPPTKIGSMYRVTFMDENNKRIPAKTLDGRDFWGGTWHPNMITDAGLDELAAVNSSTSSTAGSGQNTPGGIRGYLAVSESLQEVKEKSSPITASQSGTTITASAGFFDVSDVGKTVVFPGGEAGRITSFNSATAVEVDTSQTVSSSVFERWHTDLTALPGAADESSSTGGFIGKGTWQFADSIISNELPLTRVVTLSTSRNITGFGMRRDGSSSPLSIVDVLRDPSGAPITVSLVGGKKVRVDHTLIFRGSTVPFENTISVDEYDAANQLVSQDSVDVDAWLWFAFSPPPVSYIHEVARAMLDPGPTLGGGSHNVWAYSMAAGTGITPGAMGSPFYGEIGEIRVSGATRSAYVPGSRRIELGGVFSETAVGDTMGYVIGGQSGLRVQYKDGYFIPKTADYTLEVGVELRWDRDYTP